MANNKFLTIDSSYHNVLKEAWKIPFDIENSFPEKIAKWIKKYRITSNLTRVRKIIIWALT